MKLNENHVVGLSVRLSACPLGPSVWLLGLFCSITRSAVVSAASIYLNA